MILIAHRGNISGKNTATENSIKQIQKCLSLNLHVEIDIWFINNIFYLGHDKPQYIVSEKFLENPSLWCHAKNNEALFRMMENSKIHCFWHDSDSYTITSRGYIWAYPGQKISQHCVCVLPELHNYQIIDNCFAVCTDNIEEIKKYAKNYQ